MNCKEEMPEEFLNGLAEAGELEDYFKQLNADFEEEADYLPVKSKSKVKAPSDPVTDMLKAARKFKKSIDTNVQKNAENPICSLSDFEISGELNSELKQLMCEVIQFAESEFYGFSWNHLLESSPDYQGGRTFSDFDEDETAYIRMCELHIVSQPKVKKSKNGNQYYISVMEDANSRSHAVTFWQEDFDRFQPELEFWQGDVRKGHFVRIRLKRPDPPFKNYTFESPLKQFRWKEVPKDKADDCRLQIMAQSTMLEETTAVPDVIPEKLINVEALKTMKIMEI